MSNSERTLTRRQLLCGAGALMSLPALPSLCNLPFLQTVRADEPSETPDQALAFHAQPQRFCCIFFPNGVSLPPEDHPAYHDWHWFPHSTGSDYVLTRSLEPLEALRSKLTILSGLSHPAMRSSIAHITADSFLTGADSSRIYTNSISLDQLIARHVGNQTRFPSLTLSSDGGVGVPGRTQTLSFSASGRPIPSLSSPRAIFNRLFGIDDTPVSEQRRFIGRNRSLLDHVLEETAAIKRHVSVRDRDRLDEYMTSVREIEQRLAGSDRWLDAQRPTVDASQLDLDVTPRDDAEDYIRAILDLMYIALLTDSTRVITYQITSEDAKGIGDRFPNALDLPGHHTLSHGFSNASGYEQWARYDRFLAAELAYFIDRLDSTEDPFQSGSLLDHTIVYYGCSTSRTHQAVNYPLILAGGTSMGFRHGHHRQFDESQHRLSDLYITLLNQLRLPIDSFADSTGRLTELVS